MVANNIDLFNLHIIIGPAKISRYLHFYAKDGRHLQSIKNECNMEYRNYCES